MKILTSRSMSRSSPTLTSGFGSVIPSCASLEPSPAAIIANFITLKLPVLSGHHICSIRKAGSLPAKALHALRNRPQTEDRSAPPARHMPSRRSFPRYDRTGNGIARPPAQILPSSLPDSAAGQQAANIPGGRHPANRSPDGIHERKDGRRPDRPSLSILF